MTRSLLALSLLLAPLAFAHDVWIEPSSFRPAVGERVMVALRVGQHLQGEPLPRIPQLIERFILKGESREIPVIGRAGADPAGMTVVGEPGLQWIGYQSNPYPMTIEAQKFEPYLKDEGLERISAERARKGQSAAPGRERFYRCAKSLLDVPGVDAKSSATPAPLGFTLELQPRKNPYALRVGDALPLSLTFRGKPIANVLVVALRKDAPEKAVRARTDASGRVSLRLDEAGFWLIKAVHMEAAPPDAGVDWESWWASITFDLQGKRAK
jgi:uncharacterized GH25 family protein